MGPVATLLVIAGVCHSCMLGWTAGASVKAVLVLVIFQLICLLSSSAGTDDCAPFSVVYVSLPSFPSCCHLDWDLQSREE